MLGKSRIAMFSVAKKHHFPRRRKKHGLPTEKSTGRGINQLVSQSLSQLVSS